MMRLCLELDLGSPGVSMAFMPFDGLLRRLFYVASAILFILQVLYYFIL